MAVADQEASTRKRKRKLMTKQERQELGDNLLAFDTTELLSHLAERGCAVNRTWTSIPSDGNFGRVGWDHFLTETSSCL